MSLEDNFIDSILKKAARQAQERELETLDQEMALTEPHVFSDDFERKMEKMLKSSRKPYYFIKTLGKRAATIIIAIVMALSVMTFSVKAIREPVIEFIIEVYEKFTAIIFQKEDDGAEEAFPKIIEQYYQPEYIPDGYGMMEMVDIVGYVQITYSNENNQHITFEQYTITTNDLTADTEGAVIENATANGYPALFYSNKGCNTLIWTDNTYGYTISGKTNKEEIEKMSKLVEIDK